MISRSFSLGLDILVFFEVKNVLISMHCVEWFVEIKSHIVEADNKVEGIRLESMHSLIISIHEDL